MLVKLIEYLVSIVSYRYSEPSETSKMDRFVRIGNSSIPLTVFAKSSILDVWLGSDQASDYPRFFSIIVNWNYFSDPSKHLSNLGARKTFPKPVFSFEPERRRQSFSGLFILNLGHSNMCFHCFHKGNGLKQILLGKTKAQRLV